MSNGGGARMAAAEPSQDQVRVFRLTVGPSIIGAMGVLLICAVLGIVGSSTPLWVLGLPVGGFSLGSLAAFWLSRRGKHWAAVLLYLAALAGALFVVVHLVNGSTGPFAVALVSIPILASLLAGGRAAFWTAVLTIVLHVGLFGLEHWDVLPTRAVLGPALPWADLAMLVALVIAIASVVSTSAEQVRRNLALARERGSQLAAAVQRAEMAAQAESEARGHEETVTRQLQWAVQRFVTFLERVSAGDYEARLSTEGLTGGEPGMDELRRLGAYLNATVETLTNALTEMRVLQDRYAREAWAAFTRSGRVPITLRYQDGRVRPEPEGWLPVMSRTVEAKAPVAAESELGVPIMLGGELIGVLGARHGPGPDGRAMGWSEEERTVIEAAVGQLSQTLEALRLLDTMQRSASREQLALRISERVRGAMDIEEILRVVSHALGRELGASEVVVRLGTERSLLEGERP
ncbi:MAG: hypothetical protein JXA09_14365 [Anaerolineae bacterium]|nr:hypothetical protein [Anaerolineae bacterium]